MLVYYSIQFILLKLIEAVILFLLLRKLSYRKMTYKLIYFNTIGRGEPIKFLFYYGGLKFEEDRISKEYWKTAKSEAPFGQLPVLKYEDKEIHQTMAICRYLAKQVKLVGKDDWEDLEIDAAVDTVNDVLQKVFTGVQNKETFKEQFAKEDVIYFLKKLDEQIKKNNGYLAVGRLTWADLVFGSYMDLLVLRTGNGIFGDYPEIEGLIKKVEDIPGIKEYMAKRSKDDSYESYY